MEIEKDLTRKSAIVVLRQLADALEKKSDFALEELQVSIPAEAEISLEYEEDEESVELEIELSWPKVAKGGRGRFELYQGQDDHWYFRLKAANGQTILTSQKYKTKQGAEKGISSVQKNASTDRIEYRTSQSGQPYFVLKAANKEIIGTSQMYKRKGGCEKGVRSVVSNGPTAPVELV